MLKHLLLIFVIGASLPGQNGVEAEPSKIDPQLNALLDKGERANVIVSFKKGIQATLDQWSAVRSGDRGTRNKALKDSLKETADTSQAGVVQMLSARQSGGFQYFKSFWGSNKIFIREASVDIVRQLAQDSEVVKIKLEPVFRDLSSEALPEDKQQKIANNVARGIPPEIADQNWGIRSMQVKEAWEELGGKKGEGVIVGQIDSGVRHTHEALRDNFVGVEYGWYDPLNRTSVPTWSSHHGSSTMSVIVASKDIGVAPGAKWMTCRSSNSQGYHTGEAILECMQWLSCPTLPDGTKEDCSKAPHVINNSWASERNVDDFDEDILRWRAQGIIPVFAIGNTGSALYCGTTRSPGEKNFVIGVGSYLDPNWLIDDSAIGPASDGTIKPDILAPTEVLSAVAVDDESYWFGLGTSIATPHATGLVALLKMREPEMSYDKVYQIITESALKDIPMPGNFDKRFCVINCTADCSMTTYPNFLTGHGRINALEAVKLQTKLLGEKSNGAKK